MPVDRFAASFQVLPKGHIALCPEGLSRFYWGGFTGTPVASWMTSEERLEEIKDFCLWLDQVYAFAKTQAPQAKVIAFGFSQGAATIMRWLDRSRPLIDAIVLWSGTPPEDIDYTPRTYFSSKPLVVRWGNNDSLVPWEKAEKRFQEVGLAYDFFSFEGDHKLYEEPLLLLANQVEKMKFDATSANS